MNKYLLIVFLAFTSICKSGYTFEVDLDSDGIISPDEFKMFLEEIHKKPLTFFDKNKDGLLSPEELEVANSTIAKSVLQTKILVDVYISDYTNGDGTIGLTTEMFKKTYDSKEIESILKVVYQEYSPPKNRRILVRGKKEVLTDFSDEAPFKKASAAEFSYVNNRKDSNTIWSVKGIVMLPFTFGSNEDFIFVPSIEVNRLSNDNNEDKEIDTLIARTSFGWIHESGNTDWYFSLSPTHTTDSSFDTNIKSLDLDITPINTLFGFGGSREVSKNLLIRNSLSFNVDYGKIFNNGGDEKLIEGEEFFRIGPNLKMEAWLYEREDIKFEFNYGYFKRVSGDLRSRKLFKAEMEFKLNPKGNYVLKTSYINGDTSNKLENEDTFSLGLGVKF